MRISKLILIALLSVIKVETYHINCVPLRCTRPLEVGDCNVWIIRYYFDVETERCSAFFYSGCGGNVNRFKTKKLCQRTCFRTQPACESQLNSTPQLNNETSTLPVRCTYQKDTGPCRAAFQRFYFDQSSGICRNFIYGGCKGNENNFLSKRECGNICVNI